MEENDKILECKDPMQKVTIELPCALVDRVDRLARENETTLSNILIEALDKFLRSRAQQEE